MRNFLLFLLVSGFLLPTGKAQDESILLVNASFEGFPIQGKTPRGWEDCGFQGETPPDVQPSDNGTYSFFGVTQKAFEGDTYLGMVVRDNETWEMVSQRLSVPLKTGSCYEFSLSLCRSELYVSPSRTSGQETNYTTPAKLRIWGGSGYCNRKEILAETNVIKNTRWLQYDFRFEPNETHTYIVLEAFYNTPVLFPYNGNVLVDNASSIVAVPCEDETPLATIETPKEEPEQPITTPKPPVNKPTTTPVEEKPKVEETVAEEKPIKLIKELDRTTLQRGQTIKIDKLYFEADSAGIKTESFDVLHEIFTFLAANQDVVVEIGGHTNGNPPHEYCDRLSTERAKAVADFLVSKGIAPQRLFYKGYGKRKPIASNTSADGRKLNQRVEIKILSFDG